jgi:hypothetical protein
MSGEEQRDSITSVKQAALLASLTKLMTYSNYVKDVICGVTETADLVYAVNEIVDLNCDETIYSNIVEIVEGDESNALVWIVRMNAISQPEISIMAGILGLLPEEASIHTISCAYANGVSSKRNQILLEYLKTITKE